MPRARQLTKIRLETDDALRRPSVFFGGFMISPESIKEFAEKEAVASYELLLELARIPAPSNKEERRAEFCLRLLHSYGADSAYIDDALNVIYPIGVKEDSPIAVYMAHSDVVFPDETPLSLSVRDGRVYCPGVGDDTANAVALITAAKYIAERGILPKECGLLLVINSGEEGLGNLKGTKRIMAEYGSRVKEFVTFDGYARSICTRAVGSMRYRIRIKTAGGHSYAAFGNRNAIHVAAELISSLYEIELPSGGKTTYNVGEIRGGTSVNTIAEDAELLYEFRSDNKDSLAYMKERFAEVIEAHRSDDADISVEIIGERPSSASPSEEAMARLTSRAAAALSAHYGYTEIPLRSSSTDANVPLSMSIPAICMGCVTGGGAHTRDEYVETESLLPGIKTALEMILHHF